MLATKFSVKDFLDTVADVYNGVSIHIFYVPSLC